MSNPKEIQAQLRKLGANLRRARMSRKITLEVLAERANLNIRTLQKFEAGESNILITTVFRLRKGMVCPWDELLGE